MAVRRVFLSLTEFGEHLGTAALRALLLWDGIVGTCEPGGYAVLAWFGALSDALDFASVTAVTRTLIFSPHHKAAKTEDDVPVACTLDSGEGGCSGRWHW